jgi:superfamily II DNA or RNA helicase
MKKTNDIILKINSQIFCYNLPRGVRDKIHKDLTLENPLYKEAIKSGRFISSDLMPFIYLFATDADKEVYRIPRGYVYYLKKYLSNKNLSVKIIDNTLLLPKLNLKFIGKLREYQQKAEDDMVTRYPVGVLEASTGAGKTVTACAIIARRQQPTLIIVHNKELLYQWQGAIKKFLNYDCGLIGDSKFSVKSITVGIINTVKNRYDELTNKFGQLVIDEVHRCPSTTFSETLINFPARHYLGLSATPYRRDGLGFAINAYMGPVIHKVNKEMLHDVGAVLKPSIIRIETNFRYFFQNDYSTMIKQLTSDYDRNMLIADNIYNEYKQSKQNVLVVSDRTAHCKEIAHILLERYKMKSAVLISSIKPKDRTQIVDDVRNGKVHILISTVQLIGEGFDAPNLSSIFLTTPIKFSGRLLQVVGRILRPSKSKTPKVYDFRDNDVAVLRYGGFNRDRIYRKQWN